MIKRMILTMLCCWGIMATVFSATNAMDDVASCKLLLQHGGKITGVYDASSFSSAVNAAVDGDTIFISSGGITLNSSVTIDKELTFIGATADEDNRTGLAPYDVLSLNTEKKVVFEGIYFQTSPSLSNAKNVVFKKCGGSLSIQGSSEIANQCVLLDRCYFTSLNLHTSMDNIEVKNCRIGTLSGTGKGTFKFNYCNIYECQIGGCLFTNCILSDCWSNCRNDYIKVLYAVNSSSSGSSSYCEELEGDCVQDCVTNSSPVLKYPDVSCLLTTEQLKEKLLGYDGGIIGADGGVNPYTLVRNAPIVKTCDVKIEPNQNKITIEKISVSANNN